MNLQSLGANQTEIDLGAVRVFFSYKTPVACSWAEDNHQKKYVTDKYWSRTTSRHINKWVGGGFPLVIQKPQEYFDRLTQEVK